MCPVICPQQETGKSEALYRREPGGLVGRHNTPQTSDSRPERKALRLFMAL